MKRNNINSMKLSEDIIKTILDADAKALATQGNPVNVVPVSTIKIRDNKIILVNYFMGKTLENIKNNPDVALACWKGLEGCRVRATAEYITEGPLLEEIKVWVKEILPDRTVRGLLILEPKEVYDISATAKDPGIQIL